MFSERLKRNPTVTDHDLKNALEDLSPASRSGRR